MGAIVQHWLLLTDCWHDPRRSLMKAAKVSSEWFTALIVALDHRLQLKPTLQNLLNFEQVETLTKEVPQYPQVPPRGLANHR